jgi:hypothetical protein
MTTNSPPPNPAVDATWIDDAGELHYFNGNAWVLYEDPLTPLTGTDHEPWTVSKGAAEDGTENGGDA